MTEYTQSGDAILRDGEIIYDGVDLDGVNGLCAPVT